jgi:hypothetical protein
LTPAGPRPFILPFRSCLAPMASLSRSSTASDLTGCRTGSARPALPLRLSRRVPLLLLAALLPALAGCDGGAPEPPGAIQGTVTGEGTPLPGVTVELTGALNRVTETASDGRYRFDDVPAGSYVVSVRNLPPDAAFPAVSRAATIPGGSTVSVDFQGNFIRTASISGTVRSRSRGVQGVTVRLTGPDVRTAQTGGDGAFSFQALRSGPYEIEISGFPSSITFPSTTTGVQLQPGQNHVATFEGDPELTATVVIRSLEQVLPGGARVPADPLDVSGTLVLGVTVDPGEDTPDSVMVSLGGRVVGVQRFNDPQAAEGLLPPVAALIDLSFAVPTGAFDPESGVPRHPNGDALLSVRLATREGGPAAWTASAQLTLRNTDTFVASVLPERGPVADDQGRSWVGGDLVLRVLPVVYTAGRTVGTLTVDLRGATGGLVARRTVIGSVPTLVTFGALPGDPGSIAGHVTAEGPGDRFILSEARYGDGTSFPGLPRIVAEGVRVDQVAPNVSAFELPPQGNGSFCCLDNWVGSAFLFSDALGGLGDPGVGGTTFRIHAGPEALSDAELLDRAPVVRGGDLEATPGSTPYRALVVLTDALDNTRTVRLEPGPGNPVSGTAGARFGVDLSVPTIALATGGLTLPQRSVNPASDGAWGFVVDDAGSGFGPLPVRLTVRRFGPADPPQGSCLVPAGGAGCPEVLSGLFRPLPTDPGPGYLRLDARSVDRGGNTSTPLRAWALFDTTPPAISTLFLAQPLAAGAEARVGLDATDDVDLHRGRLLAGFGSDEGSPVVVLPVAAPPETLGTPFDGALSRTAAIQFRFDHVSGIQFASGGGGGDAAAGPVHPVRSFRARVEDAAGNTGTRTLVVPAPTSPVRGFDAGARGAEAAVQSWRIEADQAQVCRPGGSCAPGTPSTVRLTARAEGAGANFPVPFDRVHFVSAGSDPRHLGTAHGAQSALEGGVRVWRWILDWTPPADLAGGTAPILVIGVDAEGNGLLVGTAVEVTVLP